LGKNRQFYRSLIESKGGTWKKSVSNQTNVLIVGNYRHSTRTTKYKKAMKLGIKIIDEDGLGKMLDK